MTTLAILLSALGIFYCGYLYRADGCLDPGPEPRATRLLDGERFVPPGRSDIP